MRQIKIWSMLFLLVTALTSCLKSSDTETTLYNDAVIVDFTLGTVNRYLHTTSSTGADSVYKTTYSGSSYGFSIDQNQRIIYNADSLPLGTDAKHIVCNITTLNNGVLTYKHAESDTLYYYYSTDSIDFTVPRTFYVYSSDGTGRNAYTVVLNVHEQDGEQFHWQKMSDSWTPSLEETPTLPEGISQIIGHSTSEQYALSSDNRLMVSRDNGITWEEELVDEDATMLPLQDISIVSYPMLLADSTDYVVMVGNRPLSTDPNGSIAMVWRKIVDYSQNGLESQWTFMEHTESSSMALPRLKNLKLVKYDDGILALGAEGIGGCYETAYSQFYQSRDNGITWKYNSRYKLPEGFDKSATEVDMDTDDENFIWLRCKGTGQLWRGRLNRLGWEVQDWDF